MKTEKTCYELSPSQDVSYLQCKYTLFKRVINIIPAITINYDVDFDLMEKAFNLVVERNDCLRIKFFKRKGKLMQYFEDSRPYKKIPVVKYDTEEQFNAFVKKYRRRAIDYLHGKVIEPNFIKTHDGKNMILFKVCHLVVDVYGLFVIYMDLLNVYNALKNGEELPAAPASFEEVVKRDIERHYDMRRETKHAEFFKDMLSDKPEPYYAGIHGPEDKSWQKQLKKNHRGMGMSFIRNDTEAYIHLIGSDILTRVFDYCKANQVSPANFLFYTCSLTSAMLNNNVRNSLPLSLCNCRITQNEKTCAGSKVQSIACYTRYSYKKTFEENIKRFSASQAKLYMHVGFSDREFETMLHKAYHTSIFETYYSMAFSFVPFEVPDGIDFTIYSNGKGALAAYVIQLFDTKSNTMRMAYDVQTKTTTPEHVARFHEMYKNVLTQVLDNPQILLKDIVLEK